MVAGAVEVALECEPGLLHDAARAVVPHWAEGTMLELSLWTLRALPPPVGSDQHPGWPHAEPRREASRDRPATRACWDRAADVSTSRGRRRSPRSCASNPIVAFRLPQAHDWRPRARPGDIGALGAPVAASPSARESHPCQPEPHSGARFPPYARAARACVFPLLLLSRARLDALTAPCSALRFVGDPLPLQASDLLAPGARPPNHSRSHSQ